MSYIIAQDGYGHKSYTRCNSAEQAAGEARRLANTGCTVLAILTPYVPTKRSR